MKLTTKATITLRPSMRVPTLNFTTPFCHHVIEWTIGATFSDVSASWIHCASATQDNTNDAPTARIPISEPLRGRRFPIRRMRKNEIAGRAGMIQALSSTAASALQLVDLVEVGTVDVAVDEKDDRQPDTDLGGRDGDDEEREHLARHGAGERRERDQVDVHRVQHELDAHEHEHRVTAGDDAIGAGAEQERAEDQELLEGHRQSLRAMTTAPTSAARSSIETTSNGTT